MKSITARLHEVAIDWPQDLVELHRLNPARYPFLLESVAQGSALGRYDILFACPGDALRLTADFSLSGPGQLLQQPFLQAFDHWWSTERKSAVDGGLPFTGGWFVMLGYELGQQIEDTLSLRTAPDLPVAVAVRVPVAIVRDRVERQAYLVAEHGHEHELTRIRSDLDRLARTSAMQTEAQAVLIDEELQEEDPRLFISAVERAQAHIRNGDIFQANLARQWQTRLQPQVTAADLYASLRNSNPAPFAGLAAFADFAIISSSPERLLRVHGERVETRPIAGTRPRITEPGDIRRELLDNPKERAEHVMVIDLERNDLGRICAAGTVDVDEFMSVETYEHVHHIVSNVSGRLQPGITPGGVIAAVFPGGSITGCPKVRCMEIIAELEGRPRGMYTGAMGFINRDGSLDLSILIRCFTLRDRLLTLSTGCGIVADSDPALELAETRAKARGLLRALGTDVPEPDPDGVVSA